MADDSGLFRGSLALPGLAAPPLTPIPDQFTGKKGLTIAVEPLHGEWILPMGQYGTPSWLQKGKDQKMLEKVSSRECSTGDGAEVGSCRSPARETCQGSAWACSA